MNSDQAIRLLLDRSVTPGDSDDASDFPRETATLDQGRTRFAAIEEFRTTGDNLGPAYESVFGGETRG